MISQQAENGMAAAATAVTAMPLAAMANQDVFALAIACGASVAATFMFDLVDTRMKAVAGVVIATLLGGYGAPAAVAAISSFWPALAPAMEVGRPLVTILLGFLSPVLLPGIVAGLKRRSGRMAGGDR